MDIKKEEKSQKNKKIYAFLMFFLVFFMIFSSFLLFSCGKKSVPVKEISLSESQIELSKGQKQVLYVNVLPENANNYSIVWSSSDSQIAYVDKYNFVVGKNYGEAVITATVKGTDIKAECHVIVSDGIICNISIECPVKVYYEGQKFDESSLKVYAIYESGKSQLLNKDEYQATIPEVLTQDCRIAVNYKNFPTRYYSPLVVEDYVDGIELVSHPNKTNYIIGEKFDDAGMEVELVYASGKREKTTDFSVDTTNVEYKQTEVKVTYNKFTLSIPIISRAQITVDSISEIQSAINDGYTSIMVAEASYNTTTQIAISSVQEVLIFGEGEGTNINGYNIIPIKIEGDCGKITLSNLTFTSIGDTPASHQIDLSDCLSGEIIFDNLKYQSILEGEGYTLTK